VSSCPPPHSILPSPLLALLPPPPSSAAAAPFFCHCRRSFHCCRWASLSPAVAAAAEAFPSSHHHLDAAVGAFPYPCSCRRRLDSTAGAFPFPCSRHRRLHSVALLHFPRRRDASTSSCALPPKRHLTDALKTMGKTKLAFVKQDNHSEHIPKHSWHQPSCDAGSQVSFHEKHKRDVATRFPQCPTHHCAPRIPELKKKVEYILQGDWIYNELNY
jgi:hypothetical protein